MERLNYIDEKVKDLAAIIPGNDNELLRMYVLLSLVKGKQTTLQDVHDAWSAWKTATNPDHKSLIPFVYLSSEVQELDRNYMEAIHNIS